MRRTSESPWLLAGLSLAGLAGAMLLEDPKRRRSVLRSVGSMASAGLRGVRDGMSRHGPRRTSSASWVPDGLRRAEPAAPRVPTWLEKAKSQALRGAMGYGRQTPHVSRDDRGADWHDVHDEVEDAMGPRHDRGHPVLTAGTALLLLGSAVYLLGLSPGAEDRRRRYGDTARRWIGDIGELARRAGRAVGSRAGNTNTRGQHDPTEPVARPTAHPVELHGRITDAIAAVSSGKSDVTVLIREGVVVIQGTAAPEEYDAIVRAIDSVTHTYVNEIQAVSLT